MMGGIDVTAIGMMDRYCPAIQHNLDGNGDIVLSRRGRRALLRPLKDGSGYRICGPGQAWKSLRGKSPKGLVRAARRLLPPMKP